jgi:hypothetical protein
MRLEEAAFSGGRLGDEDHLAVAAGEEGEVDSIITAVSTKAHLRM